MKKSLYVISLLLLTTVLSACSIVSPFGFDDNEKVESKAEYTSPDDDSDYVLEQEAPVLPPETTQYAEDPFYGVWCFAGKVESNARNVLLDLEAQGFDARMFVSNSWSNLNPEMYYVVTAGMCSTEAEANQLLVYVKNCGYPSAYVKYSGYNIG